VNGLSIQVDARDEATGHLAQLANNLRARTGLNESVAQSARVLTQHHFIRLSATRHATAERLGAVPSGFFGLASDTVTSSATSESGVVTIHSPGIGRAAHDVDIFPGEGKEFLAIPQIAAAYNQRAYRVPGLFRPVKKGATAVSLKPTRFATADRMNVLGKAEPGGGFSVWYQLVRSVHQKQDRSLLPSDEEYMQAALEGVREYIDLIIMRGNL
jgi:hypothetical protein